MDKGLTGFLEKSRLMPKAVRQEVKTVKFYKESSDNKI